jgi:hypothetical protein
MLEVFGLCMHSMGQDCLDISQAARSMHSLTGQPHHSTCMMVSINVACYKLSSHKDWWDAFIPLSLCHIVLRLVVYPVEAQ